MCARSVVLWISFAVASLAAGLAILRLLRPRIQVLVQRAFRGVAQGVGCMVVIPLILILFGSPLAAFLPVALHLHIGWEDTLLYKVIMGFGSSIWLTFVVRALTVRSKKLLGGFALVLEEPRPTISDVQARSFRMLWRVHPIAHALMVCIVLLPIGVVSWRTVQGYSGPLTVMTGVSITFVMLNIAYKALEVLSRIIDRLFGKTSGVPLVALLLGIIASLLSTLVAVGIFGPGE